MAACSVLLRCATHIDVKVPASDQSRIGICVVLRQLPGRPCADQPVRRGRVAGPLDRGVGAQRCGLLCGTVPVAGVVWVAVDASGYQNVI